MKTKLLGITAMLLLSAGVFAQEKEKEKKCELNHAFGFNVGSTSGIGLSYQLWHKQKCAMQLTAGPRLASVDDQNLNFGLAGIYKLRDKNRVDFLAYGAVNYIYKRGYPSVTDYNWNSVEYKVSNFNKVNIGVGIGFEFNIAGDFYLNAMGGYGAYSTNNMWRLSPAGEASIFYKL